MWSTVEKNMEITITITIATLIAAALLALRIRRAKMTLRALPAPQQESLLAVRSRPHTEEELRDAFWHEVEVVEDCKALDAGEELEKLKAEMAQSRRVAQ